VQTSPKTDDGTLSDIWIVLEESGEDGGSGGELKEEEEVKRPRHQKQQEQQLQQQQQQPHARVPRLVNDSDLAQHPRSLLFQPATPSIPFERPPREIGSGKLKSLEVSAEEEEDKAKVMKAKVMAAKVHELPTSFESEGFAEPRTVGDIVLLEPYSTESDGFVEPMIDLESVVLSEPFFTESDGFVEPMIDLESLVLSKSPSNASVTELQEPPLEEDFVISPSNPKVAPHLRVLDFSFKTVKTEDAPEEKEEEDEVLNLVQEKLEEQESAAVRGAEQLVLLTSKATTTSTTPKPDSTTPFAPSVPPTTTKTSPQPPPPPTTPTFPTAIKPITTSTTEKITFIDPVTTGLNIITNSKLFIVSPSLPATTTTTTTTTERQPVPTLISLPRLPRQTKSKFLHLHTPPQTTVTGTTITAAPGRRTTARQTRPPLRLPIRQPLSQSVVQDLGAAAVLPRRRMKNKSSEKKKKFVVNPKFRARQKLPDSQLKKRAGEQVKDSQQRMVKIKSNR
jgi:hypothetical protein